MKLAITIIAIIVASLMIGGVLDSFWSNIGSDKIRYLVGFVCCYFAFFHRWSK